MTTALVTGSTRGIGLATARALAESGHRVYVTGTDAARADAVAEQLRRDGLSVQGIGLDVGDFASVQAAASTVRHDVGALDILVNNAGVVPEGRDASEPAFVSPDALAETFRVNVVGAAHMIEAFLPLLMAAEAARIVNVSSAMGSLREQQNPDHPFYGMIVPAYQASKAALNSMTIGLGKQLRDTAITVTSVCPGFVRTDLTPMNATAPRTPEDAASVVVRAASLSADERSGQFFDIDGSVEW